MSRVQLQHAVSGESKKQHVAETIVLTVEGRLLIRIFLTLDVFAHSKIGQMIAKFFQPPNAREKLLVSVTLGRFRTTLRRTGVGGRNQPSCNRCE